MFALRIGTFARLSRSWYIASSPIQEVDEIDPPFTNMFQDENGPLTLQKQALLYIICNLERFKVEALKVLPEKVRRELLANLPAIDIIRLEEAGVADDIDPSTVWDEVCAIRIIRAGGYDIERNIMYDVFSEDWKAYFFGIIIHVLLDHVKPSNYRTHYELVLHLLLGVQDCIAVTNWSKYRFSYFAPIVNDRPLIPYRHLKHLTTRRSDINFIKFIMDVVHYTPRFLYVVIDLFGESDVYKSHSSELLSRFLCRVKKVTLAFDYDDRQGVFTCFRAGRNENLPYDATSLIMKAVLSNDPPTLTSLEFREFNSEMLDETLKIVGPLFYAAYSSLASKVSKHIPYRGLQELLIAMCASKCPSNEVLQKLTTVVKNQSALEKITLQQLVTDKAYLSDRYLLFLSSLSPHVKKATFRSLRIKRVCLSIEGVQNLIEAFLSSPCLQRQTLCFEGVTIIGEPSEDNTPRKIAMHEDSMKFKSLEFYSCDFPTQFFKWVLGHPHVWLYKFEIANCKFQEELDPYYGEIENLLHLLAEHRDLRIHHLNLCNIKPIHNRTSTSDFGKLLSNRHIKTVSFRACNIGHRGLLPDLTTGLAMQVDLGTLEGLSLINNELGDLPLSELQHFLNTLFSLASTEKCDVNLSHNVFTTEHYRIIYDTWKAAGHGKRFKTFMCVGRDYPKRGDILRKQLNELAIKNYHW